MSTHKTGPSADDLESGAYYCFQIGPDSNASGAILDGSGEARWRYITQPRRSPYSVRNLLKKPDFVLADRDDKTVLRVRQTKRFLPCFNIIANHQVVGTVEQRSILRNTYRLTLQSGLVWTFAMPLFTVRFWGESSEGTRVWVQVGPSKRQWNLLFESGADSAPLLGALAFIHREWWCYS